MNETVRGARLEVWIRVAFAFLSLGGIAVGVWALFVPMSFYEDFPLPGREWVSALGPYNEHLVRDVGALNLAFGVLLALSGILMDLRLLQVSLVAYLVYSVGDNLANLILLGLLVVLPLAILIRSGLRDRIGRSQGNE